MFYIDSYRIDPLPLRRVVDAVEVRMKDEGQFHHVHNFLFVVWTEDMSQVTMVLEGVDAIPWRIGI